MEGLIDRQKAINKIVFGIDDKAYFGDADIDWKVIDFLNSLSSVTPEEKTGEWIGDAKTYYEELNKRGLGVDEYTPYFMDDIACSECLAKYSMLDNETQFFKYCPNCGARMQEVEENG